MFVAYQFTRSGFNVPNRKLVDQLIMYDIYRCILVAKQDFITGLLGIIGLLWHILSC